MGDHWRYDMIIVWILWSDLIGIFAALGWLSRDIAPVATNILWFIIEPVLLIGMIVILWKYSKRG
jgi:hypothetical protein